MYKDNKISVIIAAAGSGKRLGSGIPKQYIQIDGVPMLVRTLRAFEENEFVDEIVVVASADFLELCENQLSKYSLNNVILTTGGKVRQDSVYQGLLKVSKDSKYVLVHDAARPFVSQHLINKVISNAVEHKAVVLGVDLKDTVVKKSRVGNENQLEEIEEYYIRSDLSSIQTPGGFEKDLLKKSMENAFAMGIYCTDEGSLVETFGEKVYIVPGDYKNYKITTKEDLKLETRIGIGYDVHRLVEDRNLVLGGVIIPYEKGLLGHSDADVLVHAIIDALLGAAALGDIGRLFPDNDMEYKGISSIALLERVGEMLYDLGYQIGNIDGTIICEKPKISKFVEEMKNNISKALGISSDIINIKGTTTEKLGFEGRQEGISAQAVCLINK